MAVLDPLYDLADVLFEVIERVASPAWTLPRLILQLLGEFLVREGKHAAVGVVDEASTATFLPGGRGRSPAVEPEPVDRDPPRCGVACLDPSQCGTVTASTSVAVLKFPVCPPLLA
jgi:hypothetical protein